MGKIPIDSESHFRKTNFYYEHISSESLLIQHKNDACSHQPILNIISVC